MEHLKSVLASLITPYLAGALEEDEAAALMEYPADPKNGDISFPCFKLAKAFRKSPAVIAKDLAAALPLPSALEKISSAGGYINFYIAPGMYAKLLENSQNEGNIREIGKGKTVCLDFSSPNIAKKFHLGHIGSTVIGNALRNLFHFCGYKTIAINHLGDWGTGFGKLICAYQRWSSKEKVEKRGVAELEEIYARYHAESRENPMLDQDARDASHRLEEGDAEYLEIWRYFKEISLREYMKTYALLGISFDSYNGESFYTDKMPGVVENLREKGLLKIDDGASVVDLSAYNMPPVLILRRDGATLYPTRDIAAAKWRKEEYDFDKCIYVTSAGQSLHFAQWFKVVDLLGYDWADSLVHVPYGTMSFGGEKLASRTGNIIHLDDLLEQAVEKAGKIIEEKNAVLADKHAVAVAVGVGAVVFNALFNARIKDVDFSWETALSFEGNTGPYLQYTYARACSVLRKCGKNAEESPSPDGAPASIAGAPAGDPGGYAPNADEKALVKALCLFETKIRSALGAYEPSVITRYLLEISGFFNQFYHSSPIMRAESGAGEFRIALTKAYKATAAKCLDILGMQRPEEI